MGQKRLFRGLGATHCADRNRYARGGIRRGKHVATSVENSAGIDDHARRMYFSGDDALGLNFDAALGKNYPIEAAGDDARDCPRFVLQLWRFHRELQSARK